MNNSSFGEVRLEVLEQSNLLDLRFELMAGIRRRSANAYLSKHRTVADPERLAIEKYRGDFACCETRNQRLRTSERYNSYHRTGDSDR